MDKDNTETDIHNRKNLNAIIESRIREFKAVNIPFGLNYIDNKC